MIAKYIKLLGVLLLGFPLAGCFTEYGPVEVETAPVPPSAASVATTLQPGERAKVTVYGEEALTGEYDVNPAGFITMPLIGTVRAAGRTQTELARDLQGRFRRGNFLQDPHVTVVVVQYKPFYVLGEATTPGEYPFRSGLTVHAAVAMAGGFTYRASRSIVLIRHAGDEVWREYPLTEAVSIAPGDVIRIPERYF
jgi:protein involved in polysaccharide export with SLBB domain